MNNENNDNLGNNLGSVGPNPSVTPTPIPNPGNEMVPPTPSVNSNPMAGPSPSPIPNPVGMGPQPETLNNNNVNNSNLGIGLDLNNNLGSLNNNSQMNLNAQGIPNPEPAFTNPSNIAPSMPGFESSSQIGMTPPISFEPEKQPKKKTNKTTFIIAVIAVLAIVGFGVYYVLNYTNLLNNQKAKVTIAMKENVTVNLGDDLSKLTIDTFATITGTQPSNCSVDYSNVDLNNAGEYDITVKCGEMSKTGKLTIVDNTTLTVKTKTVYKSPSEVLIPSEFAYEYDPDLTFEFSDPTVANSYLNNTSGTYTVSLKVRSSNGKTTTVDGKLVMIPNPIKGYVVCTSNPQNDSENTYSMIEKLNFGISNNDTENNVYGGVANRIYTLTFSDETAYNNKVATYKTSQNLNIEGINGGDVTFDDSSKTITINQELTNDDILDNYGENITTYVSIRNYCRDTLGYSFNYEQAGVQENSEG